MSKESRYQLMVRNWRTGKYQQSMGFDWKPTLTREEFQYYHSQKALAMRAISYQIHSIDLTTGAYRLERMRDKRWHDRELKRLEDGTYTPLPWDLEPIEYHCAHAAMESDVMVAFTPDADKGELDIQTRMKPGRYLTRFYPHLGADEIRRLACSMDKANEVRFAESADDIETVYTNGPESCMSHSASAYLTGGIHPTRVYGAGDLAVAYLSALDIGHENFRATARVLCWPAKKIYSRIYGDGNRLVPALKALGYSSGELRGAKLDKIECKRGYVMPYIDWHDGVDNCGDYFRIGSDMSADSTSGFIIEDPSRYRCDSCNSRVDKDETCSFNGDGCYCESCYSDMFFYCPRSESDCRNDEGVTLMDTSETVSEDWAHDNLYCDDDGNYWENEPEPEVPTTEKPLTYRAPDTEWKPGMRVRFRSESEDGKWSENPSHVFVIEAVSFGMVKLEGREIWESMRHLELVDGVNVDRCTETPDMFAISAYHAAEHSMGSSQISRMARAA